LSSYLALLCVFLYGTPLIIKMKRRVVKEGAFFRDMGRKYLHNKTYIYGASHKELAILRYFY